MKDIEIVGVKNEASMVAVMLNIPSPSVVFDNSGIRELFATASPKEVSLLTYNSNDLRVILTERYPKGLTISLALDPELLKSIVGITAPIDPGIYIKGEPFGEVFSSGMLLKQVSGMFNVKIQGLHNEYYKALELVEKLTGKTAKDLNIAPDPKFTEAKMGSTITIQPEPIYAIGNKTSSSFRNWIVDDHLELIPYEMLDDQKRYWRTVYSGTSILVSEVSKKRGVQPPMVSFNCSRIHMGADENTVWLDPFDDKMQAKFIYEHVKDIDLQGPSTVKTEDPPNKGFQVLHKINARGLQNFIM